MATHINTLRWDLRDVLEIGWPELGEDAIGMAASVALGISGLPPLLDAPWPRRWFEAAGVKTPGNGLEGMPTAKETVAVLDAVLDGRLVGTTGTPDWPSRDHMPKIKDQKPGLRSLWVRLVQVLLLPTSLRVVRRDGPAEQEHRDWLRTKWKARDASRRQATRPAIINRRTVPLRRAAQCRARERLEGGR